jgi:large subunit ribosomal protein L13e
MKGNHAIPVNIFRKTAVIYKEWHNEESRKERLARNRIKRAREVFPKPIKALRPIIRCSSVRYNRKERLGRGFTPSECKEAGMDHREARRLGIAVDMRRKDANLETFKQNVERIKTYKSRVTIFKSHKEAKEAGAKPFMGDIMPVVRKPVVVQAISKEEIASYE